MKTSVKLLVIGALASTSLMAVAKGGDGEYRCEMRGQGGHHGQGYHQEKRGHHGGDVRKMLRGLDLTAEQKTQIQALIEAAHVDKPKRDMAKMEAHMAARHALMTQPTFDEAAAREMIRERQANMADRALARMKLQHDIIQVLTDEQKAKLAERHAERMERFRAHHGE